jgi:predicted RNA binding protein YcfA (HicA-like mRNA interferase family)
MPRLRVLSGRDVLQILSTFGFAVYSQRGSHVKLRKVVSPDTHQTLTIVFHDEIDKGTLRAIYRQALRFIDEAELRQYFYTD